VPSFPLTRPHLSPSLIISGLQAYGSTKGGFANSYNWTIPSDVFNAVSSQNVPLITGVLNFFGFRTRMQERCVFRIRYNITTAEFNPAKNLNAGTADARDGRQFGFKAGDSVDASSDADASQNADTNNGLYGIPLQVQTKEDGKQTVPGRIDVW
jgi:hypothetical protein